MVLFDMVGDCDLEIPREANSDPGLYQAFADAAERQTGSPAPFEGTAAAITDDHTPFDEAGVPAVDLIDFGYGPGPTAGGLLAHAPGHLRHVCAREPRRGRAVRPWPRCRRSAESRAARIAGTL